LAKEDLITRNLGNVIAKEQPISGEQRSIHGIEGAVGGDFGQIGNSF
jgi:hypothetical protein